jgi:hypothetical protein
MHTYRDYFDKLYQQLTSETSAPVYIIPAGLVLYELGKRIKAGEVPGLTSSDDLFRDRGHLAWDVGRYAAAVTIWTTMTGMPVSGEPDIWHYRPDSELWNIEGLRETIDRVVWEVVSGYPHTGVSNE